MFSNLRRLKKIYNGHANISVLINILENQIPLYGVKKWNLKANKFKEGSPKLILYLLLLPSLIYLTSDKS